MKNGLLHKTLSVSMLFLAVGTLVQPLFSATYPELPVLNWSGARSDWIDVTRAPYNADKTGNADATSAIQSALNKIREAGSSMSTVYLPPGTYKISQTLTGGNGFDATVNMIGHGRTTKIIWAGASGGRMYRSNGAAYSLYEGIVWDGQGIAAEGSMHDAAAARETNVIHRNEAYMNFTSAGSGSARNKPDQRYIEGSMWDNCLFINCGNGFQLQQWNDYVITITGCEFYDCNYGIYCHEGNFYVRDCHFERSKTVDIINIEYSYGSSVRRCTSIGSQAFVQLGYDNSSSNNVSPTTIQDCHVSGWKNAIYAILSGFRGPLLIFDCVFTNAPSTNPPIRLGNTASTLQSLVHSNNKTTTPTLINKGPAGNKVTEVPPGRLTGSVTSAQQRFFKDTVAVPGKVFDAGELGVQSSIESAKNYGNGAIAYLPRGTHNISTDLTITGSNYYVGGAGRLTQLKAPVKVQDPDNITLQNIWVVGSLQQVSTAGVRSVMKYINVHTRALEVNNLPQGSKLIITFLIGEKAIINNCSNAKVIFNYASLINYSSMYGPINVKDIGTKNGLVGVQSAQCDFLIEDNQSIVGSDCSREQGKTYYVSLKGAAGQGEGRVTVGATRMSTLGTHFQIDNYQGSLCSINLHADNYVGATTYGFVQTGTRPLNLICIANSYLSKAPTFQLTSSCTLTVAGCIISGGSSGYVADLMPSGGLQQISYALDDFRELGAMDLELNYPEAAIIPSSSPVNP